LFELANEDKVQKTNALFDIVEEIPSSNLNILNNMSDLKD